MDWMLWSNTMVPLTYSAGPGNIMVAVSGVRVGFVKSLPFIFGLDATYFCLATVVGLGVGNILTNYPTVAELLKVLGIVYIAYLGTRFFVNSTTTDGYTDTRFRIVDGVMIQLANVKGMIMLIVMFSEFGDPSNDLLAGVLVLSFALASLNFSAQLLWVCLGASIKNIVVRYPAFQQRLNYLFGTMMIGVAAWLLIHF